MRPIWLAAQIVLLLISLTVLVGRAAGSGLSHDENKFVYAGQALADHGLLPYRDYPYDQMPYAALFYALSARLSPFDFLGARLLGALAWLACIVVLLLIVRLLAAGRRDASDNATPFATFLLQLMLVALFLFSPLSAYVLGAAKNDSWATLFALLGFLAFASGLLGHTRLPVAAFWSGLLATVAGCARLNYLGLFFVLGAVWLLLALVTEPHSWARLPGWCSLGGFVGALPLLALIAAAPAKFYYANIVQIRLTSIYYEGILERDNMDIASKMTSFVWNVTGNPLNLLLYAIFIGATALFLREFLRSGSTMSILGLTASAFAGAMLLTAFMAEPMLEHYFYAPLPFLLIVMALSAGRLLPYRVGYAALLALAAVLLLVNSTMRGSFKAVSGLLHPQAWPPLQVHRFAQSLLAVHDIPAGKVLTLLPMVPAESGYAAYAFTASGSNSWRTSPLLTPQRRSLYGVTSPDELPALLDAQPPSAILTGIETANPGFTFRDLGGLEQPFIEYAQQHGYKPTPVNSGFYGHPLTLWLSQP